MFYPPPPYSPGYSPIRVQFKNESIQQYVKKIKKLSTNCKFGTNLTEMLRNSGKEKIQIINRSKTYIQKIN